MSPAKDSTGPGPEIQEIKRRVWKTQEHRRLERHQFDETSLRQPSRENGFWRLPSVQKPSFKSEKAAGEQLPGSGPEKPITIDDSEPSPPVTASVPLESSRSLMPPPPPPTSRNQTVYLRCSLRLDIAHGGSSAEIRDKLDRLVKIMGDYGRYRLDNDQSADMRSSVLHICRDINCEFLHRNI